MFNLSNLFDLGRNLYALPSYNDRSGKALMPLRYFFELTYRCNLQCPYCYVGCDRNKEELTTQEWFNLIDQIPFYSFVTLVGGEPLIRKDFIDILMRTSKKTLGKLNVVSNGILINDEIIDAFIKSNMMLLSVSLDGYGKNHDINRAKEGIWDKIMDNFDNMNSRNKRPMVDIKTIVLENNLDDLSKRLYKAKTERENQEQLRMDFFANVSHELRTPITVMRGYTETLNDGVITDEVMVNEYYRKMLIECRSMERLVGDLFILSKMQNPDFKIEKEPVSIRQVFGDVLRSAREIARKKNITITQKLSVDDEEPCMILGDYERLRQMFMIIIDNAVKFSYESGEIIISIEKRITPKKQVKIYVSIQDFGVGISKEALPYIFEKFYKSKLKQNQKGTGLGLMIAKQIALRHGCDIMVESEIEQGTKFSFEFEECVSMDEYE